MRQTSPKSVVVGIDGSAAAICAAEWAVDEAASRCLPLRLVHVIEPGSEAVRLETEYAEASLSTARAAVDATGRHVRSDAIVVHGSISSVLIEESRHAAMMCVGSSGVDYPFEKLLGSVARSMAQSAHCPAAVIRTPNARDGDSRCIAVVVGDPNTADAVLRMAMDEARLRTASLLILRTWPATRGSACDDHLNQRMILWGRRYPDVEVHPVSLYTNLAEFLTKTERSVLLTLVDAVGSDEAKGLGGPSAFSRATCPVIVVSPDRGAWSPKQRRPVTSSLRPPRASSPSPVVGRVVSVPC
jgi:nucleotide-binding universal stress UspA family protein